MKTFPQKKSMIVVVLLLAAAAMIFMFSLKAPSPEPVAANPELVRIMQVMDKYKATDIEILVDGIYRRPEQVFTQALLYLRQNFKAGDTAEQWAKEHAYLTAKGNVMYFRYPDGKTRPMRDVFLEDLQSRA